MNNLNFINLFDINNITSLFISGHTALLSILMILSVIFSLTVITSTNPVIAVIFLIGVFLSAALYLILIKLVFIGLSYIIVYIGAITVLFLFIIMMLNTDILDLVEIGPEYGKNLPLAYTISFLFFIFFLTFLSLANTSASLSFSSITPVSDYLMQGDLFDLSVNESWFKPEFETSLTGYLQIQGLGTMLYTNMGLILLLSSLILLLALITPIVLNKRD